MARRMMMTQGVAAPAGTAAAGARVAAPAAAPTAELALPGFPTTIRMHHWALFGLMVIVVSQVHQTFGIIGKFRPALLLMALVTFYALARPKDFAVAGAFRQWPPKFVTGLAIAACGSVPFGLSMGSSGKFLIDTYFKTLLVAFLTYTAITSVRQLRFLVWAYVVATTILGFTSVFMGPVYQDRGAGMARLVGTGAYDANDTGLVVLMGLPLTLLVMTHAKGWRWLLGLGTLGLIGMTVAKTGSRGAFLGLVTIGLGVLLTVSVIPIVKRVILAVAVAGALAVTAPPGYWDQMRSLLNPKDDYNFTEDTGRKAILLRGIGYMLQYPIFGVGVNNFPIAEGTISDIAKNLPAGQGFKWSVAHNSFLQASAEMGIPGAVLFTGLVLGGMVSGIPLRRRLPKRKRERSPDQAFLWTLSYYLPLSFAVFLVSGFFVSFAYLDHIYFMGLLVAASRRLAETAGAPDPAGAAGAPAVVLPVAATPPVVLAPSGRRRRG